MFVRKKQNKSGTRSIQIISKSRGKYKVIKTIGCAKTKREEELMVLLANTELKRLEGNQSLFIEHDDQVVDNFVNSIANDHLQIIGSELILGKIYDKIGYPKDGCPNYFRNLVLCRLVYPGSKLKTVEYFRQHLNLDISVYLVYRFLDELNSKIKPDIEQVTFDYTKKLLKGKIGACPDQIAGLPSHIYSLLLDNFLMLQSSAPDFFILICKVSLIRVYLFSILFRNDVTTKIIVLLKI